MITLWQNRKRRKDLAMPERNLRDVLADPYAKTPEARPKDPEITCGRCRRRPHEIPEYVESASEATGANLSPAAMDRYVRSEEGTYDPDTNRFLCDECYIRAGMPVNADGRPWKCP